MDKKQAEQLLKDFARFVNSDGSSVLYKCQVDTYLASLDTDDKGEIDPRRPRGYSKGYL